MTFVMSEANLERETVYILYSGYYLNKYLYIYFVIVTCWDRQH